MAVSGKSLVDLVLSWCQETVPERQQDASPTRDAILRVVKNSPRTTPHHII